jgi:hypothetical protein
MGSYLKKFYFLIWNIAVKFPRIYQGISRQPLGVKIEIGSKISFKTCTFRKHTVGDILGCDHKSWAEIFWSFQLIIYLFIMIIFFYFKSLLKIYDQLPSIAVSLHM